MYATTREHLQRVGLVSPLATAITAGLFVLLLVLTSKQIEYVPVINVNPPTFRPLPDRVMPPDPPDAREKPVEPVVGREPLPIPTPTPEERTRQPGPSESWVYHGPGPTGAEVEHFESRDPIVIVPPRGPS